MIMAVVVVTLEAMMVVVEIFKCWVVRLELTMGRDSGYSRAPGYTGNCVDLT